MSFHSLSLAALMLATLACCAKDQPGPSSPVKSESTAVQQVDIDDPESCRDCHAAVVDEWQQSMHARAHHGKDPIYAGVRRIRMKREGDGIAAACALCHTPRSPDDHEAPAAAVGVACAACHNVAAVHAAPDRKGSAALEYAGDTLLLGPHDSAAGASDVHGTGAAPPHMRDGSTLCLACHDQLSSPSGIPICTTGPELAESTAPDRACTSCHMPRVPGPSGLASERADHASHTFPGPHRAWYQDDPAFVATAVDIEGSLEPGALAVTVRNRAGHAFPTGFPGRMAMVRAVGFDADGNEVWASWTTNAMVESPQSVFNKVYIDADGKPTLAPYAAALKRDTRLAPGEARTIELSPPASVRRVKVSLIVRLLPPPLADKTGVTGAIEGEPRVVRSVEIAAASL